MRSPTLSAGPAGAGREDRFSEHLTAAFAGARRRALRDGDKHIDTAHLLHSLLESDPRVRAAFAGDRPRVARLLGYLVQRTIGYGLLWSGTLEDSGALPVRARAEGEVTEVRCGGGVPGWSPAAAAVIKAAIRRAAARGAERAEGPDLLAALAYDRRCRAAEVLRRVGVDTEALVTALDEDICQHSTG